ncbi:MAG TPA: tRNA (N(6)-L-threonylcarbamoyladenosine(37)-C(2))-methylthiotransferase MtaB [Bacteroidales bacterium]|nr:tRNA (N(6)-L-threonylcarbamoyladenosine(37)-C(2))-methylthiotransferase MtaB [Bacteroidales bacterium]
MNPTSIAFHHFGCKVNFAEASSLSRRFQEEGYEIRNHHEPADIYVISTCVVTAMAEKKCRAAIRQARKNNPGAKIAVIGCFPELKPGEVAAMEGVDLVLGHTGKFRLLEEITAMTSPSMQAADLVPHDYHGGLATGAVPEAKAFFPSFSYGDRTRSFLKIQDGCDYFCTYCAIPHARGRSRSDTIENVLVNAREILRHGIREIVLTGVNIGDFGRQNGENFLSLICALDGIGGMGRIRISSIEPDLLSDDIIAHVAHSAHFLPHFHLPLQSGSNRILKAMHRKYTREHYASRVAKIRELMPMACIAADVITGFPGETDEEFTDTLHFLEGLDLSYMHVFTYSKRENTLAAGFESPVPETEKKRRSNLLHRLSEEKKRDFYRKNQSRREDVLFESDQSQGYMHGFTANYIRVRTPYDPALVNRVAAVRLDKPEEDSYLITLENTHS